MKIELYGNLNQRVMSIKRDNNKVKHEINYGIILENATFKVQPKGHSDIVNGYYVKDKLTTNRKVVAKLRGTFKSDKRITHDMLLNDPEYIEVTYNPKQFEDRNYFYERETGKRVDSVAIAIAIATENTQSKTRLKTYIKRS